MIRQLAIAFNNNKYLLLLISRRSAKAETSDTYAVKPKHHAKLGIALVRAARTLFFATHLTRAKIPAFWLPSTFSPSFWLEKLTQCGALQSYRSSSIPFEGPDGAIRQCGSASHHFRHVPQRAVSSSDPLRDRYQRFASPPLPKAVRANRRPLSRASYASKFYQIEDLGDGGSRSTLRGLVPMLTVI